MVNDDDSIYSVMLPGNADGRLGPQIRHPTVEAPAHFTFEAPYKTLMGQARSTLPLRTYR